MKKQLNAFFDYTIKRVNKLPAYGIATSMDKIIV